MKYVKLIPLEEMYKKFMYVEEENRHYTPSQLDIVRPMHFMFGGTYLITDDDYMYFKTDSKYLFIKGWYFDKYCVDEIYDNINDTNLVYVNSLTGNEILKYIEMDMSFMIRQYSQDSPYRYIHKTIYGADISNEIDINAKYECYYDKKTYMLQAYKISSFYINEVRLFKFDIDILNNTGKEYYKILQIDKIYKEAI